MHDYRTKLSENGRVLIPVACRKQLHLEPGAELIVRIKNNELHLLSLKQSLKKAQGEVRRYTKNHAVVEELIATRRKEADDE